MRFGKKLAISSKKNLIVNLYSIIKYLKVEKKINTKESLQCFYNINTYTCNIPVILIDSVFRKDVNYYPKVLLEKCYIFW